MSLLDSQSSRQSISQVADTTQTASYSFSHTHSLAQFPMINVQSFRVTCQRVKLSLKARAPLATSEMPASASAAVDADFEGAAPAKGAIYSLMQYALLPAY